MRKTLLAITLLALASPTIADPFVICQQRADAVYAAAVEGRAVLTRAQSPETRTVLLVAVSMGPEDANDVKRVALSKCLAEENPQ